GIPVNSPARAGTQLGSWERVRPAVERAGALPQAFRQDIILLATESLIQAVEVRLGKLAPEEVAEELDRRERTGFIFIKHFHIALLAYEEEEPAMRFYFPELLKGYNPVREGERLARVEFFEAPPEPRWASASPSAAQPAAPAGLARAEEMLRQRDLEGAEVLFERVVQEGGPQQGAALYGLAVVASDRRERARAKSYFQRALEAGVEARLRGWSHIYLGRIYDLEGAREQALEHYRRALALQTGVERIEQAALRGLEQPFGSAEP
ncbi:MAG: hypothetical protein ACE5HB_02325, partial [Terriglobia bacterium]